MADLSSVNLPDEMVVGHEHLSDEWEMVNSLTQVPGIVQ